MIFSILYLMHSQLHATVFRQLAAALYILLNYTVCRQLAAALYILLNYTVCRQLAAALYILYQLIAQSFPRDQSLLTNAKSLLVMTCS